jgi:hypothetical protein
MISPALLHNVDSSTCLFDNYTQTQLLLSELALRKFPPYIDLLPDYDIACVHRNEIVPFVPFHKALYAIKSMTTKSVQVVDLGWEDGIEKILYEGLLYVDVKYEKEAIFFKVNLELAPYWEDIVSGPFKSSILIEAENYMPWTSFKKIQSFREMLLKTSH